jgi:hypothetical protein
MASISCFYVHYNRDPINIIFVKYQNFIKIYLNDKSVILTIQQLVSIRNLFQIYLVSLLLTEDTSRISIDIENYRNIYGVSTIRYWKNIGLTSNYEVIMLEKSPFKNPLNADEPKRSTSLKKIKKFLKMFNKYYDEKYIMDVKKIFDEYYLMETTQVFNYFQRYIEHEKKIEMLSVILHNYGKDVYSAVRKHM